MRVLLAYNAPLPSRYQEFGEQVAVASVLTSVRAIADLFAAQGHQVTLVSLEPPLEAALERLQQESTDLIVNLFEGFEGRPETESEFARALAELSAPYTGATATTLSLCLNKDQTKRLLAARGIPTPAHQMLSVDCLPRFNLAFPVIVKPANEDASHGLTSDSVAHDAASLARQVSQVGQRYGSPALVEQLLTGREFNVAILGGEGPLVLPPSEIVYDASLNGPRILTYGAKWNPEDPAYRGTPPVCPAQVSEETNQEIQRLALACHAAVGAPPYARVDLREDAEGWLQVLEVNPNPDLDPEAGLALQARAAGMTYGELITKIANLAQHRGRNNCLLRPMETHEVAELVALTAATGFFHLEEIKVAEEVLSAYASKGRASGYQTYVATDGQHCRGYVCFGDTPLTRGTWDIYWVAVAPQYQGQGIGKQLMALTESEIRRQGGRLALVETSGQPRYQRTRRFYQRLGYQEVSHIDDFYDVGDARVIYAKKLN